MTTAVPALIEAPVAAKVLKTQDSMKSFGILIPAYLPKDFDRSGVEIKVNQSGPGGEPAADVTYYNSKGGAIFLRQWVPIKPALQTLSDVLASWPSLSGEIEAVLF